MSVRVVETEPAPIAPAGSVAPVATTVPRTAAVCRYTDLQPERGAAALVYGVQVALIRLHDGSVHAVSHRDPVSGANVMARGIVGSRGDRPTLASPMYKQVYDLTTGACLDDPAVSLAVYPVQLVDGVVTVTVPVRVAAAEPS